LFLWVWSGISDAGILDLIFVDYGNLGRVHMDHAYRLPPDIIKTRQQVREWVKGTENG